MALRIIIPKQNFRCTVIAEIVGVEDGRSAHFIDLPNMESLEEALPLILLKSRKNEFDRKQVTVIHLMRADGGTYLEYVRSGPGILNFGFGTPILKSAVMSILSGSHVYLEKHNQAKRYSRPLLPPKKSPKS